MGNLAATDMLNHTDIDTALSWHLRSNHFPAVPLSMLEPCKEAIANAEDGDYDAEVELPEGVSYKGRTTAPTWAMVEQHHLNAFIQEV